MRWVRFEFPSKLANEHANVTCFRTMFRSPNRFQELRIRNWNVGVCEEVLKEVALLGRKTNLAPVRVDAPGAKIDLTVLQLYPDLFLLPNGFGYPTQDCRNSSEKVRSAERFSNVVIDAGLQSSHFFLLGVTCSDGDEGNLGFGGDIAPCCSSDRVGGKVCFEDDKIGTGLAQALPGMLRVASLLHVVSGSAKDRSQALPRLDVCINNENPPRFHSFLPTRKAKLRCGGHCEFESCLHATDSVHADDFGVRHCRKVDPRLRARSRRVVGESVAPFARRQNATRPARVDRAALRRHQQSKRLRCAASPLL